MGIIRSNSSHRARCKPELKTPTTTTISISTTDRRDSFCTDDGADVSYEPPSPFLKLQPVGPAPIGDGHFYFGSEREQQHSIVTEIWSWEGAMAIEALKFVFSDGSTWRVGLEQPKRAGLTRLILESGERLTAVSILESHKTGTVAGIRVRTNMGKNWTTMMECLEGLQEHAIAIGSGLVAGVWSHSQDDQSVESLGLVMVDDITDAVLTNLTYPDTQPEATTTTAETEILASHIHHNHTNHPDIVRHQRNTQRAERMTFRVVPDLTFGLEPRLVALKPYPLHSSPKTFTPTQEVTTFNAVIHKNLDWCYELHIPAGAMLTLKVMTVRDECQRPFDGRIRLTTRSGALFEYVVQGVYTGVTYRDVQTFVKVTVEPFKTS